MELKSLEAKKTISVPSRELTYPLPVGTFWVDDFPFPHVHPREHKDPGKWNLEMILSSRGLSLLQWINCTEVRVRQRCLQKRHVSFTFSAGECLISVRRVLNRNYINHYWYKCRELLWVFFLPPWTARTQQSNVQCILLMPPSVSWNGTFFI